MDLKTVTAMDGLQTTDLISRDPPDPVIGDLDMRGANGLCIRENITRSEQNSTIPTIVLIDRLSSEAARRRVAVGARLVFKASEAWRNGLSVVRAEPGIIAPAVPFEPGDSSIP